MSFVPTAAAGSKVELSLDGTNFTVVEGCEGIPEFGAERAWIESVPINASAKAYTADIPDFGEFTLAGERQKSDTGQNMLKTAAAEIPGTARTCKVTFSTSDIATFLATIGSFKASAGKGANVRFSSKCKITGVVNWT